MLKEEGCMEIQILHKQGHSIHEIARLTGCSRNTVRRVLRAAGKPRRYQRAGRGSQLDLYKAYLQQRQATAAPKWIPASVLHREIRAQGFEGCATLVRDYLRTLKPVTQAEPLVRFETAPGQQMQVDWGVFRRGKEPLSAFVATLGCSRQTYVEFVSNEQFDTLAQCHRHAFDYFEGVPQEVLYDNMRTVISKRHAYGQGRHRFHAPLWQLSKEFGFMPRVCAPYRAKTKGKVERFIRYLRESFYVPLISHLSGSGVSLDVATANWHVRRWLDEIANQRTHGTTGQIPYQQWLIEREHLQALPPLISPPIKAPVIQLQRSPAEYDHLLEVSV